MIPFKTGDLSHIARATIPLVTQSPSGETGLSDSVIFDLIVFDQPWGAGAWVQSCSAHRRPRGAGSGKWAAGPALGFVARQPGLMWGLFNQNLISFAGDADRDEVKLSILQPILNISLPHKWSLGTSEMNATYDWDKGLWANLPWVSRSPSCTSSTSCRAV